MDTVKNQQLEQILEEIASVKTIINQNKSVLHQILLPKHFRLLMFLVGVSVIVFSLVFYYLIQHFGSLSSIPAVAYQIIFFAEFLVLIFLIYIKYSKWGKSLAKSNGGITIDRALSSFFSFRIVNIHLPISILGVILVIYFLKNSLAYYIIPTISIVFGLQFNFLGCIAEIRHFLFSGYWYLATAIIIILFNSIPAPIALCLSLGCGSLLFALIPAAEK
ncbi:hypothetical protein ACFL2O_08350 [Thermodesulfobacteriota bacterium]